MRYNYVLLDARVRPFSVSRKLICALRTKQGRQYLSLGFNPSGDRSHPIYPLLAPSGDWDWCSVVLTR